MKISKRVWCWWLGHTYGSIEAARKIVDEHGMQVGLASRLECETCSKRLNVVTWSEDSK